jgi:hypothetical protein
MAKVALAEDDEVLQTFALDCFHEPVRSQNSILADCRGNCRSWATTECRFLHGVNTDGTSANRRHSYSSSVQEELRARRLEA